jgi:hypothetical protein
VKIDALTDQLGSRLTALEKQLGQRPTNGQK